MSNSPPVIGFELGVGEFRIVTPEAVYQIRVIPELVTANLGMGVISPQIGGLPSPPVSSLQPVISSPAMPEAGFFQEISQELFDRVGQLARQLSVSVSDLPGGTALGDSELSRTGAELEDAKGQLEEVVEITEKASMTIMDLADQIQNDMDNLNAQMAILNNIESIFGEPGKLVEPAETVEAPTNGVAGLFYEKFKELKAFVEKFAGTPADLMEVNLDDSEEVVEVAAEPVSTVVFDLDTIFQTLYEFCTNESVKDHVKQMREANTAGGFNSEAVAKALSDMAATVDVDDGFYNFPIPAILKLLYSNTTAEQNKTILKKMNQTASSIFLENILPVEGQVVETQAPAPAPKAEKTPELAVEAPTIPGLDDIMALNRLVLEMDELAAGGEASGTTGGGGYTPILKEDRETIAQTVDSSNRLIKSTTHHLTRIMEALSFQDLSGQRIKKIVGLISDIQVQLLSLLVSVDTKLKAHHNAPTVVRPKEETEKVAQAEVDKMLEKLGGGTPQETSELMGPGAENRLNQGAVNDLLAELGF